MGIKFCNVNNVWRFFKGDGAEGIPCKSFEGAIERMNKEAEKYVGFTRKENFYV